MEFVTSIPEYAIPFLLVLSVLVFVHELGHYIVARLCGVKIEILGLTNVANLPRGFGAGRKFGVQGETV